MSKSIEHDIFSGLSPRAEISEKIRLIEKASLDETNIAFPDKNLEAIMKGTMFFRVYGGSAIFDNNTERITANGIQPTFFSALYNLQQYLLYIIKCKKGRLAIFMGTKKIGAPALKALLQAYLGQNLFEIDNTSPRNLDIQSSHCLTVTGIPTPFRYGMKYRKQTGLWESGIDCLISGLIDTDWTYIVRASPIPREVVASGFELFTAEIKDIKSSFLHRKSQQADRASLYYIEILEKTLKRFIIGKQQGFWKSGIYLISKDSDTNSQGAALLSAIFSGDKSAPAPIRINFCQENGDTTIMNELHSKEINSIITLPAREYNGFRLSEQFFFDIDFQSTTDKAVILGKIMDSYRSYDHKCSAPINDLTKHGLIAGVTGSGKTNTVFSILEQINGSYNIPFLVIEPAKSEYRDLLTFIPSLLVFSLGEERHGVSFPFRLNPFLFPDGISLQTHIDFLKAVFNASFVMWAPMPYILEECIHRIYEDKGWNLVTSMNPRGRAEDSFPTLTDLFWKIDEVVERIGYQDKTSMDIKAALKTRINNLCVGGKGAMLNTTASVSFDDIMSKPVVMELKYLGNDEEKAFMMGLILMAVWEYYEAAQSQNINAGDSLRHLLVIEEAHRLLANVPTEKTSEDQSNVKGKGVETFSNILAEIRAYGEGVLVSEQIPVKLAPDVIKNSNMKIMHRIVAKEDRELMGDAMNLDKNQKRHAAALETGEAIFFREGLDRAVKIKVDISNTNKTEKSYTNADINESMTGKFYNRYPRLLNKFPACNTCPHNATDEGERIKKIIETLSTGTGWEDTGIRFFLPYLIEPSRGNAFEYMASLLEINQEHFYCMAAHLSNDYIRARGDCNGWAFGDLKKLINNAHEGIDSGQFTRIIGDECQKIAESQKYRYKICQSACLWKNLYCYEGSILSKDPEMHNRLLDLLNSDDSGPGFYQNLYVSLDEFIKSYILADQHGYTDGLVICYLIHKLKRLNFSLGLCKKIIQEISDLINKQK